VKWREDIAQKKTKRFADQEYWGKPVPSFGDESTQLMVVGLALGCVNAWYWVAQQDKAMRDESEDGNE